MLPSSRIKNTNSAGGNLILSGHTISRRLVSSRTRIAKLTVREAATLIDKYMRDNWAEKNKSREGKSTMAAGCSPGQLTKAEKYSEYKREHSILFLCAAAASYNVSLDYLTGRSVDPDGNPLNALVSASIRTTEHILKSNLFDFTREIFRASITKAENEIPVDKLLQQAGNLSAAFERMLQVRYDEADGLIEELTGTYKANGYLTNQDVFNELLGGNKFQCALEALKATVKKLQENRDRQIELRRMSADAEFSEIRTKLTQLDLINEVIAEEELTDWVIEDGA